MDLSLDDESVTEMDASALPSQPTHLMDTSDTSHDGVSLPMLSSHTRLLMLRDRAKAALLRAKPFALATAAKIKPLLERAKPAFENAKAHTQATAAKIAANVDKDGIRRELSRAGALVARAIAFGAIHLAELITENLLPRLERWGQKQSITPTEELTNDTSDSDLKNAA